MRSDALATAARDHFDADRGEAGVAALAVEVMSDGLVKLFPVLATAAR